MTQVDFHSISRLRHLRAALTLFYDRLTGKLLRPSMDTKMVHLLGASSNLLCPSAKRHPAFQLRQASATPLARGIRALQ